MDRAKRAGANQKSAEHEEYDDSLMTEPACRIKKPQQNVFVLYLYPIDQEQMPRMHQEYGQRGNAADRIQVRRSRRAQTLIMSFFEELLDFGHEYLRRDSTGCTQ